MKKLLILIVASIFFFTFAEAKSEGYVIVKLYSYTGEVRKFRAVDSSYCYNSSCSIQHFRTDKGKMIRTNLPFIIEEE